MKQLQTQLYRKVCRQFGVTPASYYLRHINDKVLVMKHQALGPKGTKALTVPLQVSDRQLYPDGIIVPSYRHWWMFVYE